MRRHSEAFKQKALARWRAGESVATLAKELRIANSLLYAWRAKSANGAPKVPAAPQDKRTGHQDAIVFLRQARDAMGPVAQLSKAELLALMALALLGGRL